MQLSQTPDVFGVARKAEIIPPQRGIILIVVLWVLLILTIIAWTFANQSQMEIRMTGFHADSVRAHYLAKAGVARALVFLREDKLKDFGVLGSDRLIEVDDKDENILYDHPIEYWGFNPEAYGVDYGDRDPLFGATVEGARGKLLVEVEDLSGRLNLNNAGSNIFHNLLKILGHDEDYSEVVAAAILDYADRDDMPTPIDGENLRGVEFGNDGNEDYYYNPQQPPEAIDLYGPEVVMKNAPFDCVEELLRVPFMTDLIYHGEDTNQNGVLDDNEDDGDESPPWDNADGQLQLGLRDFVTVHGGLSQRPQGRPNLNSAPEEIIQAMIQGMLSEGNDGADAARRVVKYRNGSDGILGTDDDKRFRTLPHQDENNEGIDKAGLAPEEESRIAAMFGVASDYFKIKSTGLVNKVRKTLHVTVVRTFREEQELQGDQSSGRRQEPVEEQVRFMIIDFEEKG